MKFARFLNIRTKRNKRLLCNTMKPVRTSRVQKYNNYRRCAKMNWNKGEKEVKKGLDMGCTKVAYPLLMGCCLAEQKVWRNRER